MTGKALSWYRNNKANWQNWEEFTEQLESFYLPVDIRLRWEEEIRNRIQGLKEKARDYITTVIENERTNKITALKPPIVEYTNKPRERKKEDVAAINLNYVYGESCWTCGKKGHYKLQCPNPW